MNEKYSNNGYAPLSQEIIDRKQALKDKYSADMALVRVYRSKVLPFLDALDSGRITKAQFEIEDNKLRETYLKPGLLSQKLYSRECSAMKVGWKDKSLLDVDAKELNGTEIKNSNFSESEPFKDKFPVDMIGVTFLPDCNLDNCNVPEGNTVLCSNKHFKLQNDLEYWIVDASLKPVSPYDESRFDKYSLSKDPRAIPAQRMEFSVVELAENAEQEEIRKNQIIACANDPIALDALVKSGRAL